MNLLFIMNTDQDAHSQRCCNR